MANKTVKKKQLTIIWHVDDLNTSHVDRKVVLDTIVCMESIYINMHRKCGKRHE